MSLTKSDELKEIEELNLKSEYDEALERIEKLLQGKEITRIEKIQAKILRSEIYLWISSFEFKKSVREDGLRDAEEAYLEAKEEENISLIFLSQVWKNLHFFMQNKNKEFIDGFVQLEEIRSELNSVEPIDSKIEEFFFLMQKALFHMVKAQIDENYEMKRETIIELFKKAAETAETLGEKKWLSLMFSQIGLQYRTSGNIEKAMEYSKRALVVAEELGNDYQIMSRKIEMGNNYIQLADYKQLLQIIKEQKRFGEQKNKEVIVAKANRNLGVFYLLMGEYKESLEHLLEFEQYLGKEETIALEYLLYSIASNYWNLGEIDKAFECYQRILKIQEKRGASECPVLAQIANVYAHKGDLDKALELYEQTLEYHYRLDEKFTVAWILQSIGKIYEKKGILSKALDYLERAEAIFLESDHKQSLSGLYYQFIVLTTRFEQIPTAKEYFVKLKNALEGIDSKNLKRLILISESLILKHSDDIEDRIRAEVLFDQLLQEDLSYEYKIEILLQLSDLLLFELKRTSNERYLEKLQNTIGTLVEIGTESNSSIIIVESLWFKSQLSLLNLEIDKAREQLTQALDIAERKGMNQLALKMTKSKEQLIQQKIELETLEKTSPTISKRMEVVRVENGFKELKSKEAFEFKASEVESSKKLFSLQI